MSRARSSNFSPVTTSETSPARSASAALPGAWWTAAKSEAGYHTPEYQLYRATGGKTDEEGAENQGKGIGGIP